MGKDYLTASGENQRSYSRAVIAQGQRTVYLAGIVNYDENRNPVTDSFEVATRTTFARLEETLEEVGATLSDIVTMTVYITDPRYGDQFVKLRSEYFEEGKFPASALITVAGLGRPELMVEIQAVAVLD